MQRGRSGRFLKIFPFFRQYSLTGRPPHPISAPSTPEVRPLRPADVPGKMWGNCGFSAIRAAPPNPPLFRPRLLPRTERSGDPGTRVAGKSLSGRLWAPDRGPGRQGGCISTLQRNCAARCGTEIFPDLIIFTVLPNRDFPAFLRGLDDSRACKVQKNIEYRPVCLIRRRARKMAENCGKPTAATKKKLERAIKNERAIDLPQARRCAQGDLLKRFLCDTPPMRQADGHPHPFDFAQDRRPR